MTRIKDVISSHAFLFSPQSVILKLDLEPPKLSREVLSSDSLQKVVCTCSELLFEKALPLSEKDFALKS